MTSSAHLVSGHHTIPDSNTGAQAFIRENLSAPLPGVKPDTGMPILRKSCVNGVPDAFCSTNTMSGSNS